MDKKAESFQYTAPWTIYALSWSNNPQTPWRIACGSFIEEYKNKLRIISLDEKGKFNTVAEAEHHYPMTKVGWSPRPGAEVDHIATTGDKLRIWEISNDNLISTKYEFNNGKSNEHWAPITAFDWNEVNSEIIGTCSIDTTCSIWDINAEKIKTQLIAHDKEVYDMGFSKDSADIFASVGADGSVRLFDLRNLEHSTIIYETPDGSPLLRLSWNKQDSNYLATFQMDSSKVVILDIRVPSIPITELHGHNGPVNACLWAPHSSGHLITVGDDSAALVWDVSSMKRYTEEPILSYSTGSAINQLAWSSTMPDWVAIASEDKIEALRL